ncbi:MULTISPECIES: ATP-binding cassette domain-containing protein [Prochlorococcus]|uniref:ATP-binding cassette domain-containing protein n=1 Tax=Prochlorococcus TaxID=1218 RepID=UPI0005337A50|nr:MULTISPECIES: ATP-binding cassette domain-containing protein [Prochlorococcus]KGG12558.1 Phosphonate ABC transporter ATP-binding protein [Prochlorococcus sp. MIT 0601]
MTKLIGVNNVSVSSGSKIRLKNINLSIHAGEKVALIGPSGAGKTTLIEVINGSLKPTTGDISWKGRDINKITRDQKVRIGTLWQDLRLINELSTCQNINAGALGRHNFLWAIGNLLNLVNQKACINCLKAVQLPLDIINISVEDLSVGQRQRVAIARLLRQQADLVLADEPLSNLDPKRANHILDLFLKQKVIHSLHLPDTCLISLHRPEILNRFTRIIGIKKGQISLNSPITEIRTDHIASIYK